MTIRKISLIYTLAWGLVNSSPAFAQPSIHEQAKSILRQLSLKEKIGQKLMLDFRHWCPNNLSKNEECFDDFTEMNADVEQILSQNHVGGVILFAENLKNPAQITTLTHAFQQTMYSNNKLPVLIGIDQEGGIVTRLPAKSSVTFPGNMALMAAQLGRPEQQYSHEVGKMIAQDLKALGINVNFAPDVDVNVNPLNPIINVRAFSDSPELVAQQGLIFSKAMQNEGVAATLKHFPGHGDTVAHSHVGLPVVNHSLSDAWAIDLYPFKKINDEYAPELIMTAHIQYPALDSSTIYAAKSNQELTVPATLSRTIQHDVLREQLGYNGVVITDALDMGAIAQNFEPLDAAIKAFQAGDDIALMPIIVSEPADAANVADLIKHIEHAVLDGRISEHELDQSVVRILTLKIKLGLLTPDQTPLSDKIKKAQELLADPGQIELESKVSNDAMTLVQNNAQRIPVKPYAKMRIHILMPWLEQANGIAMEINRLQMANLLPKDLEITISKMAYTDLEAEKKAIDNADLFIVGHSTTKSTAKDEGKVTPVESNLVVPESSLDDSEPSDVIMSVLFNPVDKTKLAYDTLHYAKQTNKNSIFISLLGPYDLAYYKDVADVMFAGYDYHGYIMDGNQGYFRGPSLPAITRIIFGITPARG